LASRHLIGGRLQPRFCRSAEWRLSFTDGWAVPGAWRCCLAFVSRSSSPLSPALITTMASFSADRGQGLSLRRSLRRDVRGSLEHPRLFSAPNPLWRPLPALAQPEAVFVGAETGIFQKASTAAFSVSFVSQWTMHPSTRSCKSRHPGGRLEPLRWNRSAQSMALPQTVVARQRVHGQARQTSTPSSVAPAPDGSLSKSCWMARSWSRTTTVSIIAHAWLLQINKASSTILARQCQDYPMVEWYRSRV